MLKLTHRQRGDTLIEVLFAITVFSLIVVSSLALMNQGAAASQRSLEITLVRQQVDNQAETLRFLHEAYVAQYQPGYSNASGLTLAGPAGQFYQMLQTITATGATSASQFSGLTSCPTPPSGSFVLNTRTATVITNPTIFRPAGTYAQLTFNDATPTVLDGSDGIWIEAIRSRSSSDPNQTTGYIDFHIRGCWSAPGLNVPSSVGTIVRLYEPRS